MSKAIAQLCGPATTTVFILLKKNQRVDSSDNSKAIHKKSSLMIGFSWKRIEKVPNNCANFGRNQNMKSKHFLKI